MGVTSEHPPVLATWLLQRFASDYCRDGMLGDLLEQYEGQPSALRYWREVMAALAANAFRTVQRDAGPFLGGLLGSWAVLIVCLWGFDSLQGRCMRYWVTHVSANAPLQATLRWGTWLILLGLAHAAAGGILARVQRQRVSLALCVLLLSLLDWKLPLIGRLMYHSLQIHRDTGKLLSSLTELAVAMLAVCVGLWLALRRPPMEESRAAQ